MRTWAIGIGLAMAATGCSERAARGVGGDSDAGSGEGTSVAETSTSTSESSTSTESEGTSDSSTSTGEVRFDIGLLPDSPGEPGPNPCKVAPPGTDVAGMAALGPFAGTRAWFGGNAEAPRLVIFDDAADVEAEAEYAGNNNGELDHGPALLLQPELQGPLPITAPIAVTHFEIPNEGYFMAELTVDELIIDDFDAPVILRGSIALWPDMNAEGVTGTFDAVYCENYSSFGWGE